MDTPHTGLGDRKGSGRPAPRPARSGVVVGRFRGTVVVTVHGELDAGRAAHLGIILTDLIDGQGNLAVTLDLHDATADDGGSLWVFREAAERAWRRGGNITLNQPPAPLHEALRDGGLEHIVASKP